MKTFKKIGIVTVVALLIGAIRLYYNRAATDKEIRADKLVWGACLGKSLSNCVPPPGYNKLIDCPSHLECNTLRAGQRYSASIAYGKAPGLSEYRYAVLAVDGQSKVVDIEIKEFFEFYP